MEEIEMTNQRPTHPGAGSPGAAGGSVMRVLLALVLIIGGGSAVVYSPAKAQSGEAWGIFKTSIRISTTVRHWAIIVDHKDEDAWSWAPRIKFNVAGPIPSGSQFSVEFFMPGGRPW